MSADFETLIREHDELARLGMRVRRIATEPAVDVAGVRAALDAFVRYLRMHLSREQSSVYPALIEGRDRAASAAAVEVSRAFVGVNIDWAQYLARWSDAAIAADWAGFGAATDTIFDRIDAHLRRENEMLYPLALAGSHIRLRA